MSNPTPQQRAREILEKKKCRGSIHVDGQEVKFYDESVAIAAILEFATPEKEMEDWKEKYDAWMHSEFKNPRIEPYLILARQWFEKNVTLSTPSDKTKP
jgi:hypothetical protein